MTMKETMQPPRPIRFLLAYEPGNPLVIECVDYDTLAAWVIRDGIGKVLPRAGEWRIEPQPSSRSAAFIEETRYASAAEAYDRWQARVRGDAWTGDTR
jgi:hypothetical protein